MSIFDDLKKLADDYKKQISKVLNQKDHLQIISNKNGTILIKGGVIEINGSFDKIKYNGEVISLKE